MNIAILGYGKMGKEIERIALERKHHLTLKVNSQNADKLSSAYLKDKKVDLAIEFSKPEFALENIQLCLKSKIPIVIGTTGWYDHWDQVKSWCKEENGCLLSATNFSVGVNLFFELNRKLAELMSPQDSYKADIQETHHTEKLDSPSGTAISLAEQIIEQHPSYKSWVNEKTDLTGELEIISHRKKNVKGIHQIIYQSDIDRISIEHFAKNRKGFALGAVLAAEFILNKKGIFNMKDVLKL